MSELPAASWGYEYERIGAVLIKGGSYSASVHAVSWKKTLHK